MDGAEARSARTETEESQILRLLHAQSALLRALAEQIAALIRLLTPGEREGASLDELIARLISLVEDQGVALERIDAKVTALGSDLPPAIGEAVVRASRNRDLTS